MNKLITELKRRIECSEELQNLVVFDSIFHKLYSELEEYEKIESGEIFLIDFLIEIIKSDIRLKNELLL